MAGDARTMIADTASRLLEDVPALKKLNLVVGVDLHGRGDTQIFRLELPSLQVTKDLATDAKVRLDMRRDEFNRLADEKTGSLGAWETAFETGRVKATGIDQYLKLIAQVVSKRDERSRLRRART